MVRSINNVSPHRQLDFIFFDAGGGHRSAATALRDAIAALGLPWDVQLVNLQEVLDEIDVFRKLTGVRLQDLYTRMIQRGYTLGAEQMLRCLHVIIRLLHRRQVKVLKKFWSGRRPDAVVSFVPNLNRALGASLRLALPGTPFIVVMTDIADFPPHFWIERQPQIVLAGSPRAASQAIAAGVPPEFVYTVSGMLLHPRFYEVAAVDRGAERSRLRLQPNLPTGLVLFGGAGSPAISQIVRQLDDSRLPVQLIVICGRNAAVRERLSRKKLRMPIHLEGFTRDVPYFMQLCDFMIGKPGPGSISEAIHMGLPVIVESNSWTLPQERYNAEWAVENDVGVAIRSFRQIASAVAQLIDPDRLTALRQNAQKLQNRAVFEIPYLLKGIMDAQRLSNVPTPVLIRSSKSETV